MHPPALVYTPDAALSAALSKAIHRQKLEPVCVSRVGAALSLLRSRKFPGVIVDCLEKSAASDLLELCRCSGSNKSSVVLALTEGAESAVSWGVSFAVQRPANLDLRAFITILRAAHGMILQDFRRYRRIPIDSVVMLDNNEHSLQLRTVNVSEGGLCMRGEIPGSNKEHSLQLAHPDMGLRLQAKSYVVWTRNGHSGLQFRFMSNASREALSSWLDSH